MTRRRSHDSARSLRRAAARAAKKAPPVEPAPDKPNSGTFNPSHVRVLSKEEVEMRKHNEAIIAAGKHTARLGLWTPELDPQSEEGRERMRQWG